LMTWAISSSAVVWDIWGHKRVVSSAYFIMTCMSTMEFSVQL